MPVNERDVRHVARLARLYVEEDEIEGLVRHFSSIMTYFGAMAEAAADGRLPLDGVSPAVFVHDEIPPLREDRVQRSDAGREVLASAPRSRDGFFVVPRIMEGE